MNRIYQGRVSKVHILDPEKNSKSPDRWKVLSPDPKEAMRLGEEMLWQHHELFQDAVNYYIVALAALGTSPGSKLTQLRGLLADVWEGFDKKGQSRQGMRYSLQRAWQMAEPPTLAEAIDLFQKPLREDSIPLGTAEKAGEFLLHKLGGEAAIQQGGRDFFPMFCDVESTATFKLSATRRDRAEAEEMLQKRLHEQLDQSQIQALSSLITLGSVVNLQPGSEFDSGAIVRQRLCEARESFSNDIPVEVFEQWLKELDPEFQLPKRRGGNLNLARVNACTLFLAFPNSVTKKIFQSTFKAPAVPSMRRGKTVETADKEVTDESFIVDGEDPIKLARGSRGCVFTGFTALPLWRSFDGRLSWKEFDIAAFKEALKVYNQFQQNVVKREDKLNGLALMLLVTDGERALEAYPEESDAHLRCRLQNLWNVAQGKPQASKVENGEDESIFRFSGDARIDRLRRIINDDLAEEYRLTDGQKTAYGLRRRTMKGWGEVRRKWQSIVKKGEAFSEAKKNQLKASLDELRGGDKREQIGSYRLFEALIVDEDAWAIWREPDDQLQEQIIKEGWALDPLQSFRNYCEMREAFEEVSARPLNFTPADAQFSRRLFMFTDVCSFGKDRGEFKHDPKEQAVTVPVAMRGADGCFKAESCRLTYSAPRLLRDRIRGEDGSYSQDWAQPMVRALFGQKEENLNPQSLKDAAVQLMPDLCGLEAKRILLNFPLSLDDSNIKTLIGKASLWEKQFVSWKKGSQLPFLRWESDFDGKEGHRWWEKVKQFHVLSADLGTRHAASVALLGFSQQGGGTARRVGKTANGDWFGKVLSRSILRLPGEDAVVLRPESPKDQDGEGNAFRTECYGERGRPADEQESQETLSILADLKQSQLLAGSIEIKQLRKLFSFPEQNDKLLVALRRAQGGVAECISWHWKLSQPDNEEQRQTALKQLREQDRVPEWQALADGSAENLVRLRDALHLHILKQRQLVQDHLLQLTNRVLPLRGRGWEWVSHPGKADCHILRQTAPGSSVKKTKLRGQRGLSMARIEQLSELRRRWQSLNQSLRRQIGDKPLTASQMRNDPIPDPCPDILTKLENIREQRVNQTAHLIIAQALGLKLRTPQISRESRRITDTHGEYEKSREPVDSIVLEDLSRYLSDQGRAKSENTRLMKWCHRAISAKVKMLAEPFGIPVLETPAAYSSRFCSLTGIAGFRASEVGWEDRNRFPWRSILQEDLADLRSKVDIAPPSQRVSLARRIQFAEIVMQQFGALQKISESDNPHWTLLAPQAGGSMFLTAREVEHPSPSVSRKLFDKTSVLPVQADINAAANLALRAVAHPSAAHIHHRLRTERKKGSNSSSAREPRRFGNEKVAVIMREGDSLPKERNTNMFFDEHLLANFGRARLENDTIAGHPYASGPALWKTVNDRIAQWQRCISINTARLRSWGIEPPPEWKMRKSRQSEFDPDDNIPM